ncbi:two-component system response regulator [Ectothiorhodospira shaposhnikovii]|uniref:response regulator transcription factor n=1 Tax=Ectothiorhodospira shaposhnikovii TaxID=1054 RepID=UPI0019067758|nr:response regulator transcription factor [Ectothiorhodospira shaposhnikovii]MBK1674927.1 two-component system response regulator [Ectothiorhodospira shaposhnikovii]
MLDILLVEDDYDLATTLVQYLELEEIRCDHASNGVQGLQLLTDHDYDALLLDLNLPRLDGLTLCRKLRDIGHDIPILMLTARDQLQDKLDGFRSGTDDFLTKPFELDELVVRVRALTRRRSGQARILLYGELQMDLNKREASRAGRILKLSPTGWKLLEMLLREAPAAVPRQKLEATVWGDSLPDSNTLKVHIHHVRKAVDAGFLFPLIQTVPGFGFALRNNDDQT